MTSLFTAIRRSLTESMIRSGRSRARTELLRMNDRTLQDAGFSRPLLEAGLDAWPWRAEVDVAPQRIDVSAIALLKAERELQSLSDRELDDLAIARIDIPRAVREGRVGVELPARDENDYSAAA